MAVLVRPLHGTVGTRLGMPGDGDAGFEITIIFEAEWLVMVMVIELYGWLWLWLYNHYNHNNHFNHNHITILSMVIMVIHSRMVTNGQFNSVLVFN